MKKVLSLILSVMMILSCLVCMTSFAADDIKVTINGQNLTMDQPPVLISDRTLVPVRAIFEALGAKVDWNNETNTATGVLGGTTVEIQIENTVAKVNGKDVTLDVPALLISDRTLVPVRFISESLGAKVDWNNDTQTVIITTNAGTFKELNFDGLSSFVPNTDFTTGGGYDGKNVSLSSETDHTSGNGKSLKLSGRTSLSHRIKLLNIFSAGDIGKTFEITAYVYSPSGDGTMVMGVYSDVNTPYAFTPPAGGSVKVDAKKGEWTKLSFTYTHKEEIVTQLGFGQTGEGAAVETIFIDDISIVQKGSQVAAAPKDEINITDGHRPVPTSFSRGKGYDDLTYYKESSYTNEELFNALPKKNPIINDSVFGSMSEIDSTYGTISVVDVSGMPFTKAIKAVCTSIPEKPYLFQASFGNFLEGKAEQGDYLLLKFYARTIDSKAGETKTGHIMPIIELSGAPNTKAVNTDVYIGNDWEVFYFPFRYDSKYVRGTLRFGYALQTVEIGGYEIINYKNEVTMEQLPSNNTIPDYLKSGAEWRKEAWDRIEQIRKGDIKIVVKDSKGNAVPGADVKLDMYETEFQWGTAIGSGVVTNTDYQRTLAENFNSVANENALKWNYYLKNPQDAKNQFEMCKKLGIKHYRGHTLMWDKSTVNNGINSAYPDDLPNYFDDYNKLQEIICGHIAEIMPEFAGTVEEWDVLNEAQRDDMQIIPKYGFKIIKEWYDAARKTNTGAKLYYNDYIKGDQMVNFVKKLIDEGVDFDAVGVQSHHDRPESIENTLSWWNKIADMGKRMKVTEFDISVRDEEVQASYARDFMIAAYSTEAMDGFVIWGHYGDVRLLYSSDFTPKKALDVWQDLIYNKWWTNESGTTDINGIFSTRGYYGQYDVNVSANGKTKTVSADCFKGNDNTIVVTLD